MFLKITPKLIYLGWWLTFLFFLFFSPKKSSKNIYKISLCHPSSFSVKNPDFNSFKFNLKLKTIYSVFASDRADST